MAFISVSYGTYGIFSLTKNYCVSLFFILLLNLDKVYVLAKKIKNM